MILLFSLGAPWKGWRRARRGWRWAGYLWALPTTALGLILVPPALLTGGRVRRVEGVLELYGGIVSWGLRRLVPLRGGAAAVTLGHVVLGRSAAALDRTRAHERVHVRQAARWGPLFIPAYLAASLAAWARGGDPYRDNAFERAAFAEAGPDLDDRPPGE